MGLRPGGPVSNNSTGWSQQSSLADLEREGRAASDPCMSDAERREAFAALRSATLRPPEQRAYSAKQRAMYALARLAPISRFFSETALLECLTDGTVAASKTGNRLAQAGKSSFGFLLAGRLSLSEDAGSTRRSQNQHDVLVPGEVFARPWLPALRAGQRPACIALTPSMTLQARLDACPTLRQEVEHFQRDEAFSFFCSQCNALRSTSERSISSALLFTRLTVFSAGSAFSPDNEYRIYFVYDGSLEIKNMHGLHLGRYGPGSSFGASSVFKHLRRNLLVVAATDVQMFFITKADLMNQCRRSFVRAVREEEELNTAHVDVRLTAKPLPDVEADLQYRKDLSVSMQGASLSSIASNPNAEMLVMSDSTNLDAVKATLRKPDTELERRTPESLRTASALSDVSHDNGVGSGWQAPVSALTSQQRSMTPAFEPEPDLEPIGKFGSGNRNMTTFLSKSGRQAGLNMVRSATIMRGADDGNTIKRTAGEAKTPQQMVGEMTER